MSINWMRVSWPGGGDHEGHTITPIERWITRFDDEGRMSCGRVRCTCGQEWNVGGWPAEVFDKMTEGQP